MNLERLVGDRLVRMTEVFWLVRLNKTESWVTATQGGQRVCYFHACLGRALLQQEVRGALVRGHVCREPHA